MSAALSNHLQPYTLLQDARDAQCTTCGQLKTCRTVDRSTTVHRLCASCFRDFISASALTFRYGPGGALVCDKPIEGVTWSLDGDSEQYYGGKYMVGESMGQSAARRLAELLGGHLEEPVRERNVTL
jgi:hypothetical protein